MKSKEGPKGLLTSTFAFYLIIIILIIIIIIIRKLLLKEGILDPVQSGCPTLQLWILGLP